MRLIIGLFILAVLGTAFLVWRAIARSPKLDNLFNFKRRDENAQDIFERQERAEKDLAARERTLGKNQSTIARELNTINKKKTQ